MLLIYTLYVFKTLDAFEADFFWEFDTKPSRNKYPEFSIDLLRINWMWEGLNYSFLHASLISEGCLQARQPSVNSKCGLT